MGGLNHRAAGVEPLEDHVLTPLVRKLERLAGNPFEHEVRSRLPDLRLPDLLGFLGLL